MMRTKVRRAALILLGIASLAGLAVAETASPRRPHTHHWRYTVAGSAITARCDEDCPVTEGLVLRLFAPADLTYDGREKPATINPDASPEAFGRTYVITYADDEDNALETAPVDAGTYTASLELDSGDSISVTYTVAKAAMMAPSMLPEPIEAAYDGNEQPLVTAPEQLPEGCVGIRYGIEGDWTDDVPLRTAAGTYYIDIKFLGDENHKDYLVDIPIAATIEASPAGVVLATMTERGEDALNVSWTAAEFVDGYDVFLKKCKSNESYQCVASVEGQDVTEAVVTGLKKNTNYKGGVSAWVMKNGEKKYVLDPSPVVHVITGGASKGEVNPTSLKLNHANVTLRIGRSLRVNGTIKSTYKGHLLKHVARLRFVSSNPEIATINAKGDVEALKGGSCVVYALTNNGIWQSVNVTVDPSPESVWFKDPKKYMSVGKEMDLSVYLKLWPGKSETTITWTSSNESIATVSDKGVVKGLKKGKVTIRATATNGKRASVQIKVK